MIGFTVHPDDYGQAVTLEHGGCGPVAEWGWKEPPLTLVTLLAAAEKHLAEQHSQDVVGGCLWCEEEARAADKWLNAATICARPGCGHRPDDHRRDRSCRVCACPRYAAGLTQRDDNRPNTTTETGSR